MNKLIVMSIFIPIIFFIVVLSMIFIPVKRKNQVDGLDFNVLKAQSIDDINIIESLYLARDNKALFYRYLPGSANKVFVLLHGSGAEGRYFLPLADRLNKQLGATVILPDLRGHGRSMLSSPGDIDYIGQYEDDLADLHRILVKQYPDATLILGGHSSGGGLAIKYGGHAQLLSSENKNLSIDNKLDRQVPFDAYVLLAPYLGHDAPTVRPNSGGWVQVSVRRVIGLSLLNQLGLRQFNDMRVLFFNRPSSLDDPLQVDSYSYRLMVDFSPSDYQTELQALTQPILLLVGKEDEAFYATLFTDVMKKNAPQSQVRLLPNVKHLNLPAAIDTARSIILWSNSTL